MKKDIYRVKSHNTLEHISFHDCIIKQAESDNDKLFLYFGWLDILKTHPNNPAGKAKQTDNALVCFENVKVIKSQWYDSSEATADIDFLDALRGLEINILDILKNDGDYVCRIDGQGLYEDIQDWRGLYKHINKKIEFEYSSAYVCFNNFTANAWFDNGVVWNGTEWVTEQA